MVFANGVMFKAAQPLGATLAGRAAGLQPASQGSRGGGVRFKRASFGRSFVAAQPLRRCRLTAHHLLSRTLHLQIKKKK